MFEKVIVAEDLASINEGLKLVLKKENVGQYDVNRYCDNVFLKIKKAARQGKPYDLLITDLYFKEDFHTRAIKSGEDLLISLIRENIDIKTIVFSQEDRIETVRRFFNELQIDAFIVKGRYDSEEIKKAMEAVQNGKKYASERINQALKSKSTFEVTGYDIQLLQLLQEGWNQREIGERLKEKGIKPASHSAVEKRVNKLKTYFMARNSVQLVAKAKDVGLI